MRTGRDGSPHNNANITNSNSNSNSNTNNTSKDSSRYQRVGLEESTHDSMEDVTPPESHVAPGGNSNSNSISISNSRNVRPITKEPLNSNKLMTTLTLTQRHLTRRGSRGSYSSIRSTGEGEGEGEAGATEDDYQSEDHDLQSYLSSGAGGQDPKSPLHPSCLENNNNNNNNNTNEGDHETGGHRHPPTTTTTTSATTTATTTPSSPFFTNNRHHLPYMLSLDDDDDDEDDFDLKRYAIDFRHTSSTNNTTTTATSSGSSRSRSSIMSVSTLCRYLWFHIQSTRQQARQRRAALLLQQSEWEYQYAAWRRPLASLYICLASHACDWTDGGIAVVGIGMMLWLLVLLFGVWNTTNSGGNGGGNGAVFFVGLLMLVLRCGARPSYNYLVKRRQQWRIVRRQKRLQQQEQEQQKGLAAGARSGNTTSTTTTTTTHGKYSDHTTYHNHNHPEEQEEEEDAIPPNEEGLFHSTTTTSSLFPKQPNLQSTASSSSHGSLLELAEWMPISPSHHSAIDGASTTTSSDPTIHII